MKATRPFDLLAHAVRAKEILTVIARHGFADLVNQLEVPAGLWQRFVPHEEVRRNTPERIRLAAEELGPTFVKLGQLLSMRPDVLPHAYILELRQLQDRVQPLPFSAIEPVLNTELPESREKLFADFDETPIAAASLAQVYHARLRTDGTEVAIKVQKPGIERNVQIDLDLAVWLARQLQARIAPLQLVDLVAMVEEARRGVLRELDFLNEARNQEYFNALNPHPEEVFAPKVYAAISTARVLVMEFVSGRPVNRTELSVEKRRLIAAHGAESLMRQVLVSGFFHADPHGGNVLVTSDGRLCFLDWGLAGHLTSRLRGALAEFWVAAVEQEAERIAQIAADLAPPAVRPDLRAMEKEITLTLREELNFTIGHQQLGRAMLRLLYVFGQHGITLSRDYSLMAKALLSIEEVGRTLDPEFDIRPHAARVLREAYRERHHPRVLLRRAREAVLASFAGLHDLPSNLQRLLRRLEHDDFTINLQHRGLEAHDEAMKVAANRIALGVIIGALIIGSSLIVTTGIQPHIFGYPALGIIGYLLSAILGLYVIWDIIRHGRHK